MRMLPAVFTLCPAVLVGCSTTGGKGNIRDHLDRDITNNALRDYTSRPVYSGGTRSLPDGVAPMPFGKHSLGPWDVGFLEALWGYPAHTNQRPKRRDYVHHTELGDHVAIELVKRDTHTQMHYWALELGLQVVVEADLQLESLRVPRGLSPKELLEHARRCFDIEFAYDGRTLWIARKGQVAAKTAPADTD